MTSIRDWLAGLELEEYAKLFEANHIELELLGDLTEQHPERLGIASLGHRIRILTTAARSTGGTRLEPKSNALSAARLDTSCASALPMLPRLEAGCNVLLQVVLECAGTAVR